MVLQLTGRSLECNRVANVQCVHELRHLATVRELGIDVAMVHLDDQIHVALVVIAGHRRIRPDDQLIVDGGNQVDVLANRQTENVLLAGQTEAKAIRVVAELFLLDQWQHVLFVGIDQGFGTAGVRNGIDDLLWGSGDRSRFGWSRC